MSFRYNVEAKMSVIKVGIGVIVFRGRQVLLGKRKNAHGENTWGFPGGHLEWWEEPEDCAIRETKEEVGIEIAKVARGPWSNDIFLSSNKHYITLFMLAKYKYGTPCVLEPEKCSTWQWFEWKKLPDPLFLPIQNLVSCPHARQIIDVYLDSIG